MMCYKISEMPLKTIEIPAHLGKREKNRRAGFVHLLKTWPCPGVIFPTTIAWKVSEVGCCRICCTQLWEKKISVAWLRLIQLLLSIYYFFHSDFAFSILTQTVPFPPSLSPPLFLPDEQFKQQTVPLLHSRQWFHSKSCPCSYFLGRAIFSECICFFS